MGLCFSKIYDQEKYENSNVIYYEGWFINGKKWFVLNIH